MLDHLNYFLTTPSRYRRDAALLSVFLVALTLTPVSMVYAHMVPDTKPAAKVLASVLPARIVDPVLVPATTTAAAPVIGGPVVAPAPVWPAKGFVSLEFGANDYPYQARHTAIDIAGHTGEPVFPFMPGTVSGIQNNSSCGHCVYVDHGGGVVSHYSHLSSVTAHVGQVVTPANQLGLMGSTGWSTGPHVHFEIDVNGVPINPRSKVAGNPAR